MVHYDYAQAGWTDIAFEVATPDDRSARAVLIPLTEDSDANRQRLETTLGESMADQIADHMESGFISGKYKEFNLLPGTDESGWQWVLLLGLGDIAAIRRPYRVHDRLRSVAAIGARHFRRKNIRQFAVPDTGDLGIDAVTAARLVAEGVHLGIYRFERYKSPGNRRYTDERQINRVVMLTDVPPQILMTGFNSGIELSRACYLARNLVNTPAIDLTPSVFAAYVEEYARTQSNLQAETLTEAAMEAERLNLHLAVGRGSENPPAVSIITYTPRGRAEGFDLGIVGKGVTFDTGGYNLKPTGSMQRMYGDMGGGAAAFGAIAGIASLGVDLNVVAVIPLAENMISGKAYRPSDILLSRKGITVEVMNTDAEGRLLLADALTYACERFSPRHLVDIATLTGSMRVALGNFVSGLFVHADDPDLEERLAAEFMAAGRTTAEWVWRFPVDDDYKVQLASDVADIENCDTDRMAGAGAITAAVFLKQFVDFDVVSSWAHLDIAATALMKRRLIYNKAPYQPKEGATGVGVRLVADRSCSAEAPKTANPSLASARAHARANGNLDEI